MPIPARKGRRYSSVKYCIREKTPACPQDEGRRVFHVRTGWIAWLGVEDSNLGIQIQSLLSYR